MNGLPHDTAGAKIRAMVGARCEKYLALDAAREYVRRGFAIVPIPHGEKAPRIDGWQNLRLTENDLPEHFSNGANIGLILGAPSGYLIDVDLDAPEAIAVAHCFLPPTELVHGRPSKPRSHRWYRGSQLLSYLKFSDPRRKKDATLVELRQDGHQTLVPPSTADGEIRTWDKDGDPALVDGATLSSTVGRLAAAALLARYWPASGRHDARMALGGALVRAGWAEKEAIAFVQAVVQVAQPGDREAYAKVSGDTRAAFAKLQRNEPITSLPRLAELLGSDIVDVAAKWLGLDTRSGAMGADKEGRESASTKLVNLARELTELFHSGDSCYATFTVAEHRETHAMNSRGFRRWLMGMFFEREKRAASGEAITSTIATLEGFARFKREERDVFMRVAEHDEKIYLDLCDEHWRVVEIAKQGWRVIESKDCPVRFRHAHGMLALPVPERGGRIGELRTFLNLASDDDFVLAVAWLIGSLHPSGPYPILILHGEQGSAKSSAATVLKNLIDPNLAPRRTEPREARDLMIAANNSFVCSFDNMSRLENWLSDALCRLSTGGGFGTRSLYTNDEEIIFEAKRPVILNSIEELATRGDLLSRSVDLDLPRIPDEKRRAESEFWVAFGTAQPRLLGALLDAATAALRNASSVVLPSLPRMADFAQWVHAAEMSLPWNPGTFLRVYSENRAAANGLPLENPVADAVRKLELPWEGTATKLLSELESHVDERTRRLKDWPAKGQSLSNVLRRLVTNLRQAGINIEFDRDKSHVRSRMIHIASESGGNPSSEASEPSRSHTTLDDGSDASRAALSDASSSPSGISDTADDADDEKHDIEDVEVVTNLTCSRCGNAEGNPAAAKYHARRVFSQTGKGSQL